MEIFEGYAFSHKLHAVNHTLILFEEMMELSGIAVFINALLKYIELKAPQIIFQFKK
jgi:hypothetical protein